MYQRRILYTHFIPSCPITALKGKLLSFIIISRPIQMTHWRWVHPIPLIHEISLCVICFIKWAWKTLKKGRNVQFSLTMHPVTRIYWTAWLWQIQTTQAQGKLLMHGTLICMVLTYGWQSARVCALYIRTHDALHGANSWSVEKTCTVTCLEYASTIGYILEPVL